MMDVVQQVVKIIQREGMLVAEQQLIAAISGGPDSLCLLDCLHRLGYNLIVAHLDHQLRPESSMEADFVGTIAKNYGFPVIFGREDVGAMAGGGVSLEEAARLARYRFLARAAREKGVSVIATGHTADDQAETVLMHFLRGAGPSGLRGMLPVTHMGTWRDIPGAAGLTLIRPLLETTRKQTLAHCATVGLDPVLDPSNLDAQFFRNRLRHQLLPLLETYNPGIRKVLTRTARVMAAEVELEASLVEDRWSSIVSETDEGLLAFQVEPFLAQPTAVQRGLLREAILRLRPLLRDIGFDTIENGLRFIIERRPGKRHTLVGELEMLFLSSLVVIREPGAPIGFPQFPQLTSTRRRKLPVPGRAKLAGGWILETEIEPISASRYDEILQDQSGRVAALDERAAVMPLILRPIKSGDRIRPLGMKGSTKVADLFVNQHIPQPARASWPLVTSGEKVLWVVGLRMSEFARLTTETCNAVVLRLIAPKDDGP